MHQIDLVPTTSMAVGLPIPFSNLGMVIPEVLLPFTGSDRNRTDDGSADGFSGRVTPEFLAALRTNAEQVHTYLTTYAQYSQDFPAETFYRLEGGFNHVSKLHQDLLGTPDEKRSQYDLTHIATEYFVYLREVKAMCGSIWAKFDNIPMAQGFALLSVAVVITPLMLLDVTESSASLHLSAPVGLKIGLVLAGVSIFLAGLDASLLGVLVLSLNFFSFFLAGTLFIFIWKIRNIVMKSASSLRHCLSHALSKVKFLQLLCAVVVTLHAVAMLSNSFILYEADMLAFFIQSLVFSFALRTLQRVLSEKSKGHTYIDLLKAVLPHALLMVCVRLSKLFYACRDLQLQDGCESTTFIMPSASAMEFLSPSLSLLRILASSLTLILIPTALVAHLRMDKNHKSLSQYLVMAYEIGFVLCAVCVVVHWVLQALPQSTLRSLPRWQHIAAPRAVYAVCITIITLCVLFPLRTRLLTLMSCEDPPVEETPESFSSESRTPHGPTPRQRRQLQDSQSSHPSVEVDGPRMSITNSNASRGLVVMVVGVLLTSVWIPIAMILNDGIALSAVLTVLQIYLALRMLQQSEEGTLIIAKRSVPHCVFSYTGCAGVLGNTNLYYPAHMCKVG